MPDPSTVARPWTEAYPPGVPPHYRYPAVPVTRFLTDAARDFPDTTALASGAVRWDYAALAGLVERTAALLRDHGLQPGGRVAVVARWPVLHVLVALATWRAGGVLVPLDPDAGELGGRLAAVRPSLVACDTERLDRVQRLRAGVSGLGHVLVADPVAWAGARARVGGALRARLGRRRVVQPDDDVVVLDHVRGAAPVDVQQVTTMPADPALVTWSVARGRALPRPVVLSHGNLVAAAFQTRLWVPDVRAGREVVCSGVPPWQAHGVAGGLLAPLLVAATLAAGDDVAPTGGQLLALLEAAGVTLLLATPEQVRGGLRARRVADRDLTSVRAGLTVGGPLPRQVRARFEEVTGGGRLREAYGLAETAGLTHANPVYGRTAEGSIGVPVSDTVALVRRLDDPAVVAGVGEVGELLVAGPQVAAATWGGVDADGLVGVPRGSAWLATGDLASVDATGSFRHHGRRTDTRGAPRDVARTAAVEVSP